jgi:transposase
MVSLMSEETTTKPKRKRRSFSDEFKAGAVDLVLSKGKTIAEVARNLDLTHSALSKWVEQARADAGKSRRGTLTTAEKEELAQLRKEVRELRMEREILKKAAAFFAKENG